MKSDSRCETPVEDSHYFFHRTSTRPTPRKSPLAFGIRTTACKVHSYAKVLSQKYAWTRETTSLQFVVSRESSLIASWSHTQRRSSLMPDAPPRKVQAKMSHHPGHLFLVGGGLYDRERGHNHWDGTYWGGCTWRYIATRSSVIHSMDT